MNLLVPLTIISALQITPFRRIFYKTLTLLQVFLFVPATPLHHVILHAVVVTASLTLALWYYIIFIEYADDFALFVSITLTGNITALEVRRTNGAQINAATDS